MKQVIILMLLFVFATTSFAQQLSDSKHALTKTDYLEKSKKQKKAASILLAGGAGIIITSFIIPKGELLHDGICVYGLCDTKYKNDGIKSAFFIAGALSSLGSIPFFISSGKNRRKAASISIKMDNTFQDLVYISFPAVRLNINL